MGGMNEIRLVAFVYLDECVMNLSMAAEMNDAISAGAGMDTKTKRRLVSRKIREGD